MYRTNWGIGQSMKEVIEFHNGPFTAEGQVGLCEIFAVNLLHYYYVLALFGTLSIVVSHHMYTMPPYTLI
jgi:photosystem I P700 chlorophyll a apoprotein A1